MEKCEIRVEHSGRRCAAGGGHQEAVTVSVLGTLSGTLCSLRKVTDNAVTVW